MKYFENMKYVLVISGLDPSGKAGLILDVNIIQSIGVWASGIPTALTVQNFKTASIYFCIEPKIISSQIKYLTTSQSPSAFKIGMLPNATVAKTVFECISKHKVHIVYDPVLATSDGIPLTKAEELLPVISEFGNLIDIITPNVDEIWFFADMVDVQYKKADIGTVIKYATQKLFDMGIKNVLIKGGHLKGDNILDRLLTSDGYEIEYSRQRLKKKPRGTGCALSSAIAGFLANGEPIEKAFHLAENFMDKYLKDSRYIIE